ncbi:MAG: nicotinate (nicotinamide) nucleotide adenylyltransferase [Bacteroidales bacterium]
MKKPIHRKTALFFGSFNPIHIGHLIIAGQMVENSDLDQVWFIVSPQNPFKKKKSLLKNHHRLNLVKEAIKDDWRFQANDIEFSLPQPSYTIHTLTVLAEKYPDKRFALIIGSDNLSSFHKWKNYREILEQYQIYVYPRFDHEPGELANHPSVHLVDAPRMELSANMIREGIQKGKDMRYLISPGVYRYIQEMGLYQD